MMNRRAFLSLVAAAPVLAAMKPWQPVQAAMPQCWGCFDIGGVTLLPGFYTVVYRSKDARSGTIMHIVRRSDGLKGLVTTRDDWFNVGQRFIQRPDDLSLSLAVNASPPGTRFMLGLDPPPAWP